MFSSVGLPRNSQTAATDLFCFACFLLRAVHVVYLQNALGICFLTCSWNSGAFDIISRKRAVTIWVLCWYLVFFLPPQILRKFSCVRSLSFKATSQHMVQAIQIDNSRQLHKSNPQWRSTGKCFCTVADIMQRCFPFVRDYYRSTLHMPRVRMRKVKHMRLSVKRKWRQSFGTIKRFSAAVACWL